MSKIKIIYWSGTGNTQKMAEILAEGVLAAGKEAEVLSVDKVCAKDLEMDEVFALGCPSMGAEQLEDSEMEPFVASIEGSVNGKKIGLFGSYGWGDCEWMRDWESRMTGSGATVVGDNGITVNGEPDDETMQKLMELGKKLAEME